MLARFSKLKIFNYFLKKYYYALYYLLKMCGQNVMMIGSSRNKLTFLTNILNIFYSLNRASEIAGDN